MKSTTRHELLFGGALAIGVFVLFHFFGNGSNVAWQGRSLFLWIGNQWLTAGGDFSHGWLMPLVSLAVLWHERERLITAPKSVSGVGLAIVVLALLFHAAAFRSQQPRLSLVALVGVLWGLPFFLYGRAVARALLFPCGYLLLCFTSYFLVSITFPLRLLASSLSTHLLNGIGIAAHRYGTAIHAAAGGGFQFDVADPCSGLRSLVVMTALAAPLAYLTQKTAIKRWILFLSSVPLAVVANIIRIALISVVAQGMGIDVALTLYHDYSGYLVFVVATCLLLGTASTLSEDHRERFNQWKARVAKPTPSR